jgi:hypothetical protein
MSTDQECCVMQTRPRKTMQNVTMWTHVRWEQTICMAQWWITSTRSASQALGVQYHFMVLCLMFLRGPTFGRIETKEDNIVGWNSVTSSRCESVIILCIWISLRSLSGATVVALCSLPWRSHRAICCSIRIQAHVYTHMHGPRKRENQVMAIQTDVVVGHVLPNIFGWRMCPDCTHCT